METGGSHVFKSARHELVSALDSVREGIDDKMKKTGVKLTLEGSENLTVEEEDYSETSSYGNFLEFLANGSILYHVNFRK